MRPVGENSIGKILDYLRGILSNKERYDLEREITKDPFLEDALDGFAGLDSNELENDLQILNNRLQEKLKKPEKRKIIPLLRIAAGFILLAGLGTIIMYLAFENNSKNKLAENMAVPDSTININTIPANEARRLLDSVNEANEKEMLAQNVARESEKQKKKENTDKTYKITNPPKAENTQSDEVEPEASEPVLSMEYNANNKPKSDKEEAELMKVQPMAVVPAAPDSFADKKIVTPQKGKEMTLMVHGEVFDALTDEPIPGVTIITDSDRGTITDLNGDFQINLKNDSTLNIAFVGYQSQKINLKDLNDNNLKIAMKADQMALDEVVVMGYGTRKKQETTGAVSHIDGSQLTGIPPDRSYGVSMKAEKSVKEKWVDITYSDSLVAHCYPEGGIKSFERYIRKNSRLKPETPQHIKIRLKVESDGSLSEINIVSNLNPEYDQEARRLLQEGPVWKPAQLNQNAVSETIDIVITFQ